MLIAGDRNVPDEPHLLSPVEALERLLKQIGKPSRWIVAISGGSDSTGLLLALHECAARFSAHPLHIIAATVDHGLRPESGREAAEVGALCTRLGISHHVLRWQGEKPVTGLAAAARLARYDLLSALAQQVDAAAILLGHTLDDQIETVSMRSQRRLEANPSSEASGEAGMAAAVLLKETVWMLRPFLHTPRQMIRDHLSLRHQGWIDDPSNENMASERVRMRRALAGMDERQRVHWVARIAAAQARRVALSQSACDLLAGALTMHEQVAAKLSPSVREAAPQVLAYALGALIAVLGGRVHPPGRESMQSLVEKLRGREPFRCTIGRVLVQARRDDIYLVREVRNLPVVEYAAGEAGFWDGRFWVKAQTAATIGPAFDESKTESLAFAALPAAVANAARQARPMVKQVSNEAITGLLLRPVLRPYTQFLADFDLKLANALAQHMALAPFPPPEFNVFSRKT